MKLTTFARFCAASVAAVAILSACASGPTLVPAGSFSPGGPASVTLDRNWSDVSNLFYSKSKKVKVLSIDGILLNRLYISDGLTESDPLMVSPARGDTTTNPAPRGRAGMSLTEQMEYVASAVAELDYQKVETLNPKPVTISGNKGVRFEFTAKTSDGLNIHGLAQAVSKGSASYYIVYIAPEEHYYKASLSNVTAAMDSEKLP